jgi:3-dehydroquinate dehydratase/shikimate dehydrogenase
MICAVVREETTERALAGLAEARRQGADLAELRLDYLKEIELPKLLGAKPLPVLVTLRPAWEGGLWEGDEERRLAVLEDACRLGADWVDVEHRAKRAIAVGGSKLVLSYHDFGKTPEDLDGVAAEMLARGPAIVKIACAARGAADLVRLARLQRAARRPTAIIAMGEHGEPLRILYAKYGGALTYAALRPGAESAPGQATLEDLVRFYRAATVTAATSAYAVIGDPVAHSKSPLLFNAAFKHLGMDARYVRIRVDDASRLRELVEALDLKGLSVTIPHKSAALAAADEADETAAGIGAANTLSVRDGRLLAANTDLPAAMEALKDAALKKWSHGIYGMRALVLGAGGVSRAIAWGLKREAARVTIANRTFERGKALAEELGVDCARWHDLLGARPQIVVNGTSVGMAPDVDASPVDPALFGKDMVAMDTVYTPRRTRFLRDAEARGAATIEGVEMFLRQANAQFRIWTGRAIPTELYKEFQRTL